MQCGLQIAHMSWTEPRVTMPVEYSVWHSADYCGRGVKRLLSPSCYQDAQLGLLTGQHLGECSTAYVTPLVLDWAYKVSCA